MGSGGLADYRTTERRFLGTLAALAGLCMVLCTVSRAPGLLQGFSYHGLELALNVGYVVTFGPVLLLLALVGVWLFVGLLRQDWEGLPNEDRRRGRPPWIWAVLFLFPAVSMLFLWRQLAFEFAPRGPDSDVLAHCNTFDRMGMFVDWSLMRADFVYCFSGIDDAQMALPDVFPPIQVWLYLLLSAGGFWLAWRAWRDWSEIDGAQRSGMVRSASRVRRPRGRKGR